MTKKNGKKISSSLQPPLPQTVDDELMEDLFAQLDSRDQIVQSESATVINEIQEAEKIAAHTKQDPKNRFKARQARKAAILEQAYSGTDPETERKLEKDAKDEQSDIDQICQELALQIYEINPDGHCLFSAVADQLALLGILPSSRANYATVRQAASDYIYTHPDDFLPFLSPSIEDSKAVSDQGPMTPEAFERYCVSIRDTAEWGGEPEILALSRAYDVPIHVIQGGRPPIVVHNPRVQPESIEKADDKHVVRISYHRKMYGLGEHYNSLRPKGAFSQLSQKIHSIVST